MKSVCQLPARMQAHVSCRGTVIALHTNTHQRSIKIRKKLLRTLHTVVAVLFAGITLILQPLPSLSFFLHSHSFHRQELLGTHHSTFRRKPYSIFTATNKRDKSDDHKGILKNHHCEGNSIGGSSQNNVIMNDEHNEETTPVWCPEQQIYIGGVVPQTSSSPELLKLLKENEGELFIFGYGSLCWNPGTGIMSNPRVTTQLGRAIGWKRCWSQKSADHRGTPEFNGIVCTLLRDEEYQTISLKSKQINEAKCSSPVPSGNAEEEENDVQNTITTAKSLTEGMVYRVPKDLVEECLRELDFREKGGYSRDVIDVILDHDDGTPMDVEAVIATNVSSSNTNICKALLYRGTPDNPAFWKRPLLDLNFASAIMATSTGPSGPNDEYLYQLDEFLSNSSKQLHLKDSDHSGDLDTQKLALKTRHIQQNESKSADETTISLHYLQGCGSNQHNQLLMSQFLTSEHQDEDVTQIDEFVLTTETAIESGKVSYSCSEVPKMNCSLHAGGGHSAMVLEEDGTCYLWGWNAYGQLGRYVDDDDNLLKGKQSFPLPIVPPLSCCNTRDVTNKDNMKLSSQLKPLMVADISLGHAHTFVLERDTGQVYGFGDNSRGQVTGGYLGGNNTTQENVISFPTVPDFLKDVKCSCVAAGVFHSVVITAKEGNVLIFGRNNNNGKREQEVKPIVLPPPSDGRFIKVKCGQKHALLLDDQGRVWTIPLGATMKKSNKHGQLGLGNVEEVGTKECTDVNNHEWTRRPRLLKIMDAEGAELNDKESSTVSWKCIDIDCGWSHNVILMEEVIYPKQESSTEPSRRRRRKIYGWGRNDKGQLGLGDRFDRPIPTEVKLNFVRSSQQTLHNIYCGAESTVIQFVKDAGIESSNNERDANDDADTKAIIKRVATTLFATGWNEHGNLGMDGEDLTSFSQIPNMSTRCIVNPHRIKIKESSAFLTVHTKVALGGAHMLIANCLI